MGGFFGIASESDCISDLFFGTDYHSHLGTRRGGMAVMNSAGITRFIHDISNAQFRSKFENDISRMSGNRGIGVISDYEDQPLVIGSHLGVYAIATVGVIRNMETLARTAYKKNIHLSEIRAGEINPTELIAALINQEKSFVDGLKNVQESIEGSCSILLLTSEGIYASRDKLGRTPIVAGSKDGAFAVTMESCAFPNLDFKIERYLGPGEIVLLDETGIHQQQAPGKDMQICSFLWVYYGYPASCYEDINVEYVRYRCGEHLADKDEVPLDVVAGIPDSGVAHAIGYANRKGIPFQRPFVKYTPTWPRSFMPPDQKTRELVARMKLIPIEKLIRNQRLLFCEDSIVRGTQLKDTISRLYETGAKEIHMRPACPPLVFGCKYLNFSRSRSEMDLAARRAIKDMEGDSVKSFHEYSYVDSEKHQEMVERIRKMLNLTTLKYQKLDDLVSAIGLPKDKLCTYCFDGCEGCPKK